MVSPPSVRRDPNRPLMSRSVRLFRKLGRHVAETRLMPCDLTHTYAATNLKKRRTSEMGATGGGLSDKECTCWWLERPSTPAVSRR